MLMLLLFYLHPKYPHHNYMNILHITKMDIQDVAVVVAEVAAITREAGELPKEMIFRIILKEIHIHISTTANLPASSVAVVKKTILLEIVLAKCGATNATLIHMGRALAVGYRNLRTMVWSLNIPLRSPLKNVCQFHLLTHTLDFLRV